MKPILQPPIYFTVLLFKSIFINHLIPIKILIYSPYTYLGLLLILTGIILNLWVSYLFKIRNTTIKPKEIPTTLITSGPFRISRHPVYLGLTMILLGISIFQGNLITLMFPIFFIIAMNAMFIPLEEKNLKKAFGKKYSTYKKKVRMWI
ncbi:MAG: hypothetical protein DRP06_00560 [Candidatus Aenigmatarchaeota archaeon]|nr:MAG: hypothetical protein DRP06_00560 [Candidatus Aenigmarchaeota archaeon]